MRIRFWKRAAWLLLVLAVTAGLIPVGSRAAQEAQAFAGKTVSILSHSASTYAGVSNSTGYNSTIGRNDVYYTEGRHDVYREDTWWQQTIDALEMRLLVNNSWSGSCVYMPRKGAESVGYGDRAVNLHNDHTGEEPDVIFVYLGCNDFAYYKDTFGKAADVDYGSLIRSNGDKTFSYAAPQTTCEAYAIMLHKIQNRYPGAEIYCMTSTARRETDYTGDSYPDAGQPTAYSMELQKIAGHFGFPVIGLEEAIPKDTALFDKYMGDKRAHPNALGMDRITEEVLSVMLGRNAEICHVTSSDGAVPERAVLKGAAYNAALEPREGYALTVTMGGEDITEEVCRNGVIRIEKVTGDLEISWVISREPLSFRWEWQDNGLLSRGENENPLQELEVSVTEGVLQTGRYRLTTPVVLKHDRPWILKWKCAEDWRGVVLTSDPAQSTLGMTYLSRVNGGQLCFGTWTGKQYQNYGVDLSGLDRQAHTYCLENRIAGDGSNMIWLSVDGTEYGPMNRYYIGSNSQNSTSDWVSGRDFVFSYIGMEGHTLRNCRLDYLLAEEGGHTWKNGTCTGCGEAHPNLDNYRGKVISVLGDSISTFSGYIPVADGFNLEHLARYPQDNLLTDVNETWWMQVIHRLDARLGINDSWRGATVSGAHPVTTGTTGENACMANLTRIRNLGSNGTPDVILFYGGTNDLAHVSRVGSFDPATAPDTADLSTAKWDNLADGYVNTLLRLRHYYPEAQILCLLPTYTASYYSDSKLAQGNAVLAEICEHYGISWVDLRQCGISTGDLPDGIHPDAVGMDYITDAAVDMLLAECAQEPGENRVYTVRHVLTGAKASLGHYKGISAGEPFLETISGEGLTVTVTMGTEDITADAYANGVVSVSSVTGDLVITAGGEEKAVYADYLQTIPEDSCGKTNLWPALKHDREYYTASGWGVHSSGKVYSVTVPVTPGDQILADSFGKKGENGGTIDGIRVTWFGRTEVLESVSADRVYGEFAEKGFLTAPEGAAAVNIPVWAIRDANELRILNRSHHYKNGICTGCGEKDPDRVESMSLRYDDHYDITGKTVEIVDAGKPTSYQVGYGIAEGTPDTAVVCVEGNYLVASGTGRAEIRMDGTLYEIRVEPASISLLLLIGQSNMQGSEGDENQSIVCPEGMVYATYGDRYTMTTDNATNFAPSALTGAGREINVNGTTDNLEEWPVYLLNEQGAGKKGPDSGYAYEWVKQTGEKVWIVNAAHGGSGIDTWQDGGANYEECVLLFKACQETLRKEIAAGHFTLRHTGYFWCQGCTDYAQTAKWYVNKYLAMHENLKTELAFSEDVTFAFGGIVPVRAGHESYTSYRQGVYRDSTSKAYHESFKDLRFTGPRVAQYWMCNNPELEDIWMVCNIGEDWVWMPDGTNGVSEYFRAHYPGGTVDYTTQVPQSESWYTPTTPKEVHDSIHYNQIGYNEVGREAARNALIMLGEIDAPRTETSVEFLTWDGYTCASSVSASTAGNSAALVVPKVYPVWESKTVSYTLSDGLTWNYYDLLAESPLMSGTVNAVGMGRSVAVSGRVLTAYQWELEDGLLVSTGETENTISRISGRTENGVFLDTQYRLDKPFMLLHDQNWALEWKMTGPWYDSESTTSKKLFCEDGASSTANAMCLLVKGNEDRISIGYYGTNTHISYGLDLGAYGISVGDTHIYRLANHLNEDGSNTIYLFVDGRQIGPMKRYFTGSGGDMGTESDWLSGRDISFGYLGTPWYLLDNGSIDYICVVESGADADIHFHTWSDWTVAAEPGPEGPGREVRSCSCGETEERIVNSVWQTTNLKQYIQSVPEEICAEGNLWPVLRRDPVYYVNSKGDWDYHASRNVPSVTISVNPGDKISATSFKAAPENGHGSSNGIRVTFFGIHGVIKTLDPAGTYKEFSGNGGYLVAPEGAIAVNIPMWNNSDENELYLLNRDHVYQNGICGCGAAQPGWEPDEEEPAGNQDWFHDRMEQENSWLWATVTYQKIMEALT